MLKALYLIARNKISDNAIQEIPLIQREILPLEVTR